MNNTISYKGRHRPANYRFAVFLPNDGGGKVGVEEKNSSKFCHPPPAPPIKGGECLVYFWWALPTLHNTASPKYEG